MKSLKILLINGPNLNLLGYRQPEIYGIITLNDVVLRLNEIIQKHSQVSLSHFQSNQEGLLVERIQRTKFGDDITLFADAIIINPAAYTHTSIAIRDALLAVALPIIEVHLSNIHARETFRHHSYISDIATAVICGMGTFGYDAALNYFLNEHSMNL